MGIYLTLMAARPNLNYYFTNMIDFLRISTHQKKPFDHLDFEFEELEGVLLHRLASLSLYLLPNQVSPKMLFSAATKDTNCVNAYTFSLPSNKSRIPILFAKAACL